MTDLRMAVEDIPVTDLHNDPANVRKHGEQNLAAIKASLARFGQQKPIVVNAEGVVIAGNGTLMAARALGWRTIKAVRTNLAGADATAFAIADNRTAELAEWDDAALHQQLAAIAIEDEELLAATGFDEKELAKLAAANAPEVTEDEVPEAPADHITQPGDLWLLGKHRLLCGDSTKAEDVERLMANDRADLLLTDPPYNVDYEGGTGLKIQNDSMPDKQFRQFLNDAFRCAFDACKPGASFYIWHADIEAYNFLGAVHDCKQKVRQCLIWAKSSLVLGRKDYQTQHEPCLYGWKDGASHGWYSDRKQTTLMHFDKPSKNGEHPTMKPVALFAYLMGNSTAPQGIAYDPFLGSGTTLIAAEQLGRTCYGMEISPAYCDVIVKRWETLTGQKATREEV